MAKHAKFSPSKAAQWLNCYGCFDMESRCPKQDSSEFAAEGTAAHALLETCLKKNESADEWIGEIIEEYEVTVEMAQAVQVAIDWVREVLEKTGGQLFVEQRVDIVGKDCFGTVDIIIAEPFGALWIADYKHGKGVQVYAEDNDQMLTYAVGLLDKYPFEDVVLTIIQPRSKDANEETKGVDEWRCGIDVVKAHETRLKTAVKAIKGGDKTLTKNDKGCRWCQAKAICPAFRGDVVNALTTCGVQLNLPPADSLSKEQLMLLMNAKESFEMWLDSIMQFAQAQAEFGEEFDGWELTVKYGNRQWIDENKVIETYQDELGENLYVVKKSILSPAQLEKAIGKKRKDELEDLCEKPTRGTVLQRSKNG